MYNALGTYGSIPAWVESYTQALIGFKAMEQGASVGPNIDQPMQMPADIARGVHHAFFVAALVSRLAAGFCGPTRHCSHNGGAGRSFSYGRASVRTLNLRRNGQYPAEG